MATTTTAPRTEKASSSSSRAAFGSQGSIKSTSLQAVSTVYVHDHPDTSGSAPSASSSVGSIDSIWWDEGPSKGVIAGAVVGSVVGVTLIVCLGVWYWKRRRRRSAQRQALWGGGAQPRAIDEESTGAADSKDDLVQPYDSSAGRNEDTSTSDGRSMSHSPTTGVVSAKLAQHAKKSAKKSARRNKANDRGAVTTADGGSSGDRAIDAGGVISPGGQLPPAYDPVWDEERRQSEALEGERR